MKFSDLVLTKPKASLFLGLLTMLCVGATHAESPSELNKTIQQSAESVLYPEGGDTFYCGIHFSRSGIMFKPHHIYSRAWIRDHLKCGTHRQCLRDDGDYANMLKDLHNVVFAKSQTDYKLQTVIFGVLDEDTQQDSCQIRKHLHIVEPDDAIKGDIARTIMYMNNRYELPVVGNRVDFIRWHELDPPSDLERLRNDSIENHQGTRNPYIDNPELLN